MVAIGVCTAPKQDLTRASRRRRSLSLPDRHNERTNISREYEREITNSTLCYTTLRTLAKTNIHA